MERIFGSFSKHKTISPDMNSWLVNDFVAMCKNFKNEYGLTLWDALNEYTIFHNPNCAYQGKNYEGELFLYPLFDYDPNTKRATLKKMFYVSKPIKTLLMHDYLTCGDFDVNQTPFFNFLKRFNPDQEERFPEIDLMIMNNGIEPSMAKEILLKTSFYRHSVKKAFVLENVALGIEYKSTNIINIDFDLTFLDQSSFLSAERYSGFRELLPENLVISVGCRFDFDLPDIPKNLKKQQMLDVAYVDD